MNDILRKINKNILKNHELQKNIPKFMNHISNKYYTYGAIRMALHYYTFYETYKDDHKTWSKEVLKIVEKLNKIVCDNINLEAQSEKDIESRIKDIDKLRNEIMKKMKSLIVYTDIFTNYEAD